MTSDTIHNISPSFAWSESYRAQLAHIAETDEYVHDGELTSLAPGSDATYDWPTLKDAIKHLIVECLEHEFSTERSFDLHPASVLVPYMQTGESSRSVRIGETEGNVEGSTDEAETKDMDTQQQQPNPGSEAQQEAGTSASAAGADDDEDVNGENKTNGAISDSSSSSSHSPTSPSAVGGSSQPGNAPYVPPADTQNFYPSKRPMVSSTYAVLSPAERDSEKTQLFEKLDDFDIQPPFTIQRLAELVLFPTRHYRSARKWASAVSKCLLVTATRDAFPISPVQSATTTINGVHVDEDTTNTATELSEIELDRLDGLTDSSSTVSRRTRTDSTASNPPHNLDPLFSPIPFLAKHEQDEAAQDPNLEQIPDLELSGADRTHSDTAPGEILGLSSESVPSASATNAQPALTTESEAHDTTAQAELPDSDIEMASDEAPTASKPEAGVDAESHVNAEETAGTATTTAASVSLESSTSEALGTSLPDASGPLPKGQVDELDNPSHEITPLSATTTPASPPTQQGPSATPDPTLHASSNNADIDTDIDIDDVRSPKRRKSIASIHD
ncbi:hypothetical protein BCV70DRAFT_196818 [Testicularia cyperi]|uniref:PPP4R2-domain-containing protein n=1 Tax=Testicularia cyperi TaxID=1882483 RepID=A0A317XZ56_9BASI|nr:hypothetical protein BCV70DRAFT_196818 [Testicularia cyperi]